MAARACAIVLSHAKPRGGARAAFQDSHRNSAQRRGRCGRRRARRECDTRRPARRYGASSHRCAAEGQRCSRSRVSRAATGDSARTRRARARTARNGRSQDARRAGGTFLRALVRRHAGSQSDVGRTEVILSATKDLLFLRHCRCLASLSTTSSLLLALPWTLRFPGRAPRASGCSITTKPRSSADAVGRDWSCCHFRSAHAADIRLYTSAAVRGAICFRPSYARQDPCAG